MISINDLLVLWNRFFFDPCPASTIGLVRILIGFILILDLALICNKLQWYFGNNGLYPYDIFANHHVCKQRLNLFNYFTSSNFNIYCLAGIWVLSAFTFMIGFYTTLSAIIIFIVRSSFYNRNIYIYNSGDCVLKLIMFLMMFSRAGDGLSVDCYITGKDQLYTMGSPWCERLMMIQISTVYAYTSWLKMCSNIWVDGSASFYPINLDMFRNYYVPKFLQKSPWVQIATWLTLIVEQMCAFTIWISDLRYISIICGIILHMIFAYCLKLELFSYIMMIVLLLFIKPEDLSAWIQELCRML